MVKHGLLNSLKVFQVMCEIKLEKHTLSLITGPSLQRWRTWAYQFHLLASPIQHLVSAQGQERGQARDTERQVIT